jgi:hypothetical protein
MEPWDCNRWQSPANRPKPQAAKTSQIRCHHLRPVARDVHGEEGVDGSSPSEGSAKSPQTALFIGTALQSLRAVAGEPFVDGLAAALDIVLL